MKRAALTTFVLGALLLVSGCSWFGGGKEADKEKENTDPAPLASFDAEVKLVKVWETRIGGSDGKNFGRLSPAIDGAHIFAASSDGIVAALQVEDGKTLWRVQLQDLFREERDTGFWSRSEENLVTGGVAAGAGIVVVATVTGDLVALKQEDGSLAWRARTSSEVVAPTAIGAGAVIAQSIDGHVAAFAVADGSKRWSFSTTVPVLTIRGTSTPIIEGRFVVCAFANGHVVMIDIAEGVPRWEQRTAVAQGQSELERLIDVDGTMVVSANTLFMAGYQGNLAALDLADGQVHWAREMSSFTGVGEGFGNVYVAHADGKLSAVDMNTSREVWEIATFMNRSLTAPVTIGNYVAAGDYAGYVHLVAQTDGRLAGRKRVDRGALRSTFLSRENRLYIQGSSGHLICIEVR